MQPFRVEHDSLGSLRVPAEAYYGCQTLRAVDNYLVTGMRISRFPTLIKALAQVKKAAAMANHNLGLLPDAKKDAIVKAANEIIRGALLDEFVVDVIQGGAGTSTNMNANEVICNRGLELLGHAKGEYALLNPNDDVNMSQSTNDVYPTSLRLALIYELKGLRDALRYVATAFAGKGEEFASVLKMGRTQLQDAVPMTLGQEFQAWNVTILEDVERVREAAQLMHEINLGATAIGTGINTAPEYQATVTRFLKEETGLPIITSDNLVEATQDTGAYVQLSGVLKRVAVKLSKICNDLRLLSSGPRCGRYEINLPPRAPGSSIMPGKVNPVIPEMVNQVAYAVIGRDMTVTMGSEAGQLELNVMEPVISFSLFESIQMLTNACYTLADKCVKGITANEERCREMVINSIGIVTALVPFLGYETCANVAKEAFKSQRPVRELLLEHSKLSEAELDDLLKPENMIRPVAVKAKRP
jgi:aspartate ammonia-lyase